MADEEKVNTGGQAEVSKSVDEDPMSRLMNMVEDQKDEEKDDSPSPQELATEIEKLKKEIKVAKDGQSGASKEAMRLKRELDALREEKKVKEQKEVQNPKNILEALGYDPKETILDLNDLVDPNSATSKVLGAMIAATAKIQSQRGLQERDKISLEEQKRRNFDKDKKKLMQELDWSEDEFDDWWAKTKDSTPSLAQIYAITNPNYLIKKAQEIERAEKLKQKQNVGSLHSTLANKNTDSKVSLEDTVLSMLSGEGGISDLM